MSDAETIKEARAADELSCRELVALVTEYLDGALEPAARARFDAHLADCVGCQRHLDQMRRTIDSVGRLAEEDLEPAIRARWLAAFRSWKSR